MVYYELDTGEKSVLYLTNSYNVIESIEEELKLLQRNL